MSICLLDTSVFVEFLNVPNMNAQHAAIHNELKQKIQDGESLFLPMATILETGNHIAQNGDGKQRRKVAAVFCGTGSACSGWKVALYAHSFPDAGRHEPMACCIP